MIKKYWKIRDKHDRFNAKKVLKKYKQNRKRKPKKLNITIIETQFLNNYKYFIDKKSFNLSDIKNGIYVLEGPKTFSLKSNANESIKFIRDVASLANTQIYQKIKLIYLNFKSCEIYDLDASCVLDSVMYRLKPLMKKHNINFKVDFPSDRKSLAFFNLITTGFVNDDGWVTRNVPTKYIRDNLKKDKNIKFVDFNKNSIENDDIITTEIVEMIFSHFKNSDKYINSMGKIISEIVDNVREHSNNNSWYIVGNVIPKDEYNKSSIRLVIFNYGITISDNLKNFMNSKTIYLQEKQQKIINASKEVLKKQLSLFKDNHYEENQAYTFLAIQQGISSKIIDNININKRGSGIYKLTKEIYKISDMSNKEWSNLSIVSGNTMIKFKNKYRYKLSDEIDDKLYQINFNSANSLFSSQDSECIQKLNYNIPGAIMYIDFNFKEELINE